MGFHHKLRTFSSASKPLLQLRLPWCTPWRNEKRFTCNDNCCYKNLKMLPISSPYSPLSFPGCEAPEKVQELGCGCCAALVRSNPDWASRGHFGGEVPEGFGGGWKTLPGYDSVGRALGSPVGEAQGHHYWWESEDCCSLEVGLALVGVQGQT